MFPLSPLKRIIRMRKGFTPLEIRRQGRLTVAHGNLSLTGFTPLEAVGQPVRNKRLLTGFTLLETMIAMAIFALASIGVGGAIVSVQQSWQKQKANVNLINSARWGLEFMANEIRRAPASSIAVITSPVDGVKLELPPGGASYEVRYWRGDGSTYGDSSIIYRGMGSGIGNANSARKELVNLIDGAGSIFNVSGGSVTIDFTVKKGNSSFRLKTAARPRN